MLPIKNSVEDVQWNNIPGVTKDWLVNVWKYIFKHCKDPNELLGLPLIPTKDGFLVKANKESKTIR